MLLKINRVLVLVLDLNISCLKIKVSFLLIQGNWSNMLSFIHKVSQFLKFKDIEEHKWPNKKLRTLSLIESWGYTYDKGLAECSFLDRYVAIPYTLHVVRLEGHHMSKSW